MNDICIVYRYIHIMYTIVASCQFKTTEVSLPSQEKQLRTLWDGRPGMSRLSCPNDREAFHEERSTKLHPPHNGTAFMVIGWMLLALDVQHICEWDLKFWGAFWRWTKNFESMQHSIHRSCNWKCVDFQSNSRLGDSRPGTREGRLHTSVHKLSSRWRLSAFRTVRNQINPAKCFWDNVILNHIMSYYIYLFCTVWVWTCNSQIQSRGSTLCSSMAKGPCLSDMFMPRTQKHLLII